MTVHKFAGKVVYPVLAAILLFFLLHPFCMEQADLLENYKEYFSLLETLENEECFIQGMALGTRLTAEAFLTGKDKTE